jgi:two-component system chemotaxis response regulator CheB
MGDHDVVPARLDPTTAPWVIAIAASAGGFMGLLTILSSLPRGLPAAILIVLHRVPRSEDGLVGIFGKYAPMPVRMAVDGQAVEAGVVYLARSDQHLLVTLDGTFLYFNGGRIRHLQSSANPVMESAAAAFGRRPIAVVLSGGIVIAQDQASSEHWAMPQSAVKSGAVDYVLPLDDIGAALDAVVHGRPIGHGSAAGPVA